MEALFFYGIPATAFAIAATGGYIFGKARRGLLLGLLAVLWAGFTGVMFFEMEQARGMNGLGYALLLIGVCAPLGAGLGLGGLFGWFQEKKVDHA